MPAKLVVIGDSISQGFLSGSISKTAISYPAMIAESLNDSDFFMPDFSGEGGLPLNIENLLRLLANRFGSKTNLVELPLAVLSTLSYLDKVEDYWERGDGILPSQPINKNFPQNIKPLHRNLSVWGFEVGDSDTISEGLCRRAIPKAKDDWFTKQIPEFAMYRTARRTLNPSLNDKYQALTQIQAAKEISLEQNGIENLIYFLGANNCLATVIDLEILWSEQADIRRFAHQRSCNLWQPEHFQTLVTRTASKINEIKAKNVFVSTIPHITILPVSRGVSLGSDSSSWQDQDGYFEYYTHFWIWDDSFRKNPQDFPHLTREEVRLVDATIDEYNDILISTAKTYGWHIVDTCSLLNSMAYRRNLRKPNYQFPNELITALQKNQKTKDRVVTQIMTNPDDSKTNSHQILLDTRYLRVDPKEENPLNKYRGGLFSLDGVHPTTIGYGLIAHEFLKVMQNTNVTVNPLDWDRIVANDTLVLDLPKNLENLQQTLSFLSSKTPLHKLISIISGDLSN
jgi:hypothetical protein